MGAHFLKTPVLPRLPPCRHRDAFASRGAIVGVLQRHPFAPAPHPLLRTPRSRRIDGGLLVLEHTLRCRGFAAGPIGKPTWVLRRGRSYRRLRPRHANSTLFPPPAAPVAPRLYALRFFLVKFLCRGYPEEFAGKKKKEKRRFPFSPRAISDGTAAAAAAAASAASAAASAAAVSPPPSSQEIPAESIPPGVPLLHFCLLHQAHGRVAETMFRRHGAAHAHTHAPERGQQQCRRRRLRRGRRGRGRGKRPVSSRPSQVLGLTHAGQV